MRQSNDLYAHISYKLRRGLDAITVQGFCGYAPDYGGASEYHFHPAYSIKSYYDELGHYYLVG